MLDIYPVNAPGMPAPGTDFLTLAAALGDVVEVKGKGKNAQVIRDGDRLEQLYQKALRSKGEFKLDITVKGARTSLTAIVGGHIWSGETGTGPLPAEVMIISKTFGDDEKNNDRYLTGPTGNLLREAFHKYSITEYGGWYITSLLKCAHPDGGNGWKVGWVKEFLPLLHQELRLVKPKYILCLGTDASQALLGKQYSVKGMSGRIVEYTYPIHRSFEEPPMTHTALVMTCLHPAAVLRVPEQNEEFEYTVARFGQLVQGIRWDKEEEGLDHRVIDSIDDLKALTYEIRHCKESYQRGKDGVKRAVIAVDAEWEGEHPQNKGAYVRCIQVSWAHKKAACIVMRRAGGDEVSRGWEKQAIRQLKKICKSTPKRPVRIVGHFLNSDLEWIVPLGLDLRPEFQAAEQWDHCLYKGGFDTGLAAHALSETDDFSLKTQALRYTSAPRYDLALDEWKVRYCKEHALKADHLEGYGNCPDEVLYPYANFDADVTRRLWENQQKRLTCDALGNCCWEPFWISMRAYPGILEMNQTGLMADSDRIDSLTQAYMAARAELERKVRTWARWETFNINSAYQVREFLFGEAYNGKEREPGTPPIRLRPPEGRSLQLTPLLTTGKRPQPWADVQRRGEEDEHTPGTNKQVLSILAEESQAVHKFSTLRKCNVVFDLSEHVGWIRDHRFISQVLKSMLRPPIMTDDEDDYVRDEKGNWVYPGGLPRSICDDGFVRSHIYPTMETGRWGSARPPLQNLTKRRESDYKRILGDQYSYTLRSILMAPPGWVLVEADYIGAELYGMAMMAGDEAMIDHCRRNQLSERDPEFYDIHSNVAAMAFRLPCPPTKDGMKSIGKANLRIVAKSVIFGIAYGRGAKAIALAAKEEKVNVTVEEAQAVIDTIFEMYPKLRPFFDECRRRAIEERWLCGAFGRFRRFPAIQGWDRVLAWKKTHPGEQPDLRRLLGQGSMQVMGDIERQATNFPIQGMIADAMARAVDNLMQYREQFDPNELYYRLALQIHDAVLLLVPAQHVQRVVDEVLPTCMCKMVPIYPTTLDGVPNGTGPYYLGIDTEIGLRWSEVMLPDACLERGISPTYAHWKPHERGWTHSEFQKKIWTPEGFLAV